MLPGKINLFVDELIPVANELKYRGDYVKDEAHFGMSTEINNAWAMKTPHPEDSIDYLNLLRNIGHQLEDVACFNCTVGRTKDSSHRDKGANRHAPTKKEKNERNGSGPHNPKHTNAAPPSLRPPDSEHAKAHKDILQTLIEGRK